MGWNQYGEGGTPIARDGRHWCKDRHEILAQPRLLISPISLEKSLSSGKLLCSWWHLCSQKFQFHLKFGFYLWQHKLTDTLLDMP